MHIKFFYYLDKDDGSLVPYCTNLENPDGYPLSAYLADTGGDSSIIRHIDFLEQNLKSLNDNSINSYNLSSNSWGAYLIDDKTIEFCFLYDEDNTGYQLTLDRQKAAFIIEKWIAFLKKEPVEGYEEIIKVQ